jgi:ligand-binding sensor domain-containing protein
LLLSFFQIGGGKANAQAFNFQELSIQQGLPQSQAYAILFDSRNMAWIGTQGGGLCIYDGAEIKIKTKNDSLISNRIYSLKQIDNEIWVGQKGGVSIFSLKGQFRRNFQFANKSIIVQDIIKYENEILLATNGGVMIYFAGEFQNYQENPNISTVNCESFYLDSKEDLWCCTVVGLLNYKDPLKKISKDRKMLTGNRVTTAIDFLNYRLVGTYDGGLNVLHPTEGRVDLPALEELSDKIIWDLFVSENSELWIATLNNGVYVYNRRDKSLKNFNSENGLTNNNVKVIAADYWENIWLGTSGGGVSIFQNSPFIKYSTASGLNSNYIFSVLHDRDENLWVSTEGTGVLRINDTSTVLFDEEFGFHSSKVKALYQDRTGDVWIGTEGQGLGIFSASDQKDTIYSVKGRLGLNANWIKCFEEDPESGTMYVGSSDGGIYKVNKGRDFPVSLKFSRLKVNKGKLPSKVSDLCFVDDRLWYTTGTSGTIGYVHQREAYSFSESQTTFRNIVGKDGFYWAGTSEDGIFSFQLKDDSLFNTSWVTSSEELSSNNIYQLILNDNEIWVGTEKGLDRLYLDSLNEIRSVEHYGFEEGFEGVETNINANYCDQDDNLWFGTVNGLYKYQGGEVNYAQRKPPLLWIEDFQIAYQSIEETEYRDYYEDGKMVKDLLLPYDQNNIQFNFKAIHFIYWKNIQYRWRLSGVNPDWTPPSKINAAVYSNLTPGKYTFEVKASIDDNWDVEALQINFEIDQPYWEKFWFKASYYSLTAFILLLIILIIVFRVRRKNRAIREKLEMEKNLIELEQKALRLQMNPHFIFNVLNSIHNLIILNDPDKARYALSKFSKLMRRVLENSREKFISIDDEVETLENYVQLEKLTSGIDLNLEFDIDEELDTHEELLPPLMIQPFIENAIIHGLKDLDRRGEIKIGFKLLNEHLLECSIADNGRGRKKAAQINSQKENYHKSTALAVTQERLSNLNEDGSFVPFEIVDLTTKLGDPCGTQIVFRLQI